MKNEGTDSEVVVGRSYEANDWEGLVPEPASFVCNSNGCQVSQQTVDRDLRRESDRVRSDQSYFTFSHVSITWLKSEEHHSLIPL